MSVLAASLHVLHFFLPALVLAALLAPATVRGQSGGARRWRARLTGWLWGWLALSVLGSVVLAAGLWWLGRDGRMLTYAALVGVLGTAVALWRSR